MSTAIVFCYGTHGHIAPKLAVVAELVRRGERVIYYATERSRKKIESAGAEFRRYRHRHDDFNPTPPTEGLFSDMARLINLTETMLPDLLDEVREIAPDYLLLDTKSLWGNLVSQILSLPAITLSVVYAIKDNLIDVPTLAQNLYHGASSDKLLTGLQGLSEYCRIAQRIDHRYGTQSPGIINFLGNPQPLNIIFTSRYFQLAGDQFEEEKYKFVGPSLLTQQETVDFPFDRLGSAPLIYISLGTTFNDLPEFYRACLAAFADSPYQVVMSTGHTITPQTLSRLPHNFIAQPYVPQLEILKRAALFITHGGMNSANEGLLYQVPLLVIPQRGDQYLVASRVTELGAGLSLLTAEATPERLRDAAAHILSTPGFKKQAQAIGESLTAAGGYQRAADEILAFKQKIRR
jgi:MGT family glycosyltransferase